MEKSIKNGFFGKSILKNQNLRNPSKSILRHRFSNIEIRKIHPKSSFQTRFKSKIDRKLTIGRSILKNQNWKNLSKVDFSDSIKIQSRFSNTEIRKIHLRSIFPKIKNSIPNRHHCSLALFSPPLSYFQPANITNHFDNQIVVNYARNAWNH